ncbi:MAG: hypothetical protein HRU41_36915 [Saprospiraceae bacterium]|nr:hypothetical protein [Saprospiraceae bacterium]
MGLKFRQAGAQTSEVEWLKLGGSSFLNFIILGYYFEGQDIYTLPKRHGFTGIHG